jgi:2-polyprenyl-3-methyl-5-hydroxy-6-metoxy-1,4-benzoquinol methylase
LDSNLHYETVVQKRGRTRLASCGYQDRFDPFILNKNPHLRRLYDKLFRDFLGELPRGRLLDVGAGTGIYFDALAPFAHEIEALDLSEDMVKTAVRYCEANGLKHIHPRTGSGDNLPFGAGEFDVVISLDTLHHVPDLDRVVSEVCRVLKDGGHFFVFEPNICNPLMFLAHAIPHEERYALRRNRPAVLRRNLEARFETVCWKGVSAMITRSGGFKGAVFHAYLRAWDWTRLEKLYTRQAWLGRKRTPRCESL